MMNKARIFLFLLLTAAAGYSQQINAPSNIEQGGVITVVTDAEIDSLFTFGSGDEIYSVTRVFKTEIDGKSIKLAVLGVPSTLDPGEYEIAAESGSKKSIDIIKGTFIEEDIPLSSSMSSLRQSDDVRKAEQWRNLLIILKTVDTAHVYENGRLEIPVANYLRKSSFYGDRRRFLYDDGSIARSIHNGIDFSAEPGTPVYAAGTGRVVFSGERIISGNTIVIEHLPGVYSLYYHMNSLAAAEGDMLSAGALIGTVGATGLATGAHLHWEIRVGGVAVDPKPLTAGSIIDKDFILSIIEEQ